jgi:hypothetical protein
MLLIIIISRTGTMLRVNLSQNSQPESSSERVDRAVLSKTKHPTISACQTATIFKVDPSSISKRLAGKTRSRAFSTGTTNPNLTKSGLGKGTAEGRKDSLYQVGR